MDMKTSLSPCTSCGATERTVPNVNQYTRCAKCGRLRPEDVVIMLAARRAAQVAAKVSRRGRTEKVDRHHRHAVEFYAQ